MKVGITGHTRGIGQALFNEFVTRQHAVKGFSRSTGHDITDEQVRRNIVQELQDVDIFVNNAWSCPGQFELLTAFVEQWRDQPGKTIIHIGSKIIHLKPVPTQFQHYVTDKQRQNDFIRSRYFRAQPQILNVVLGLVDTDRANYNFVGEKIQPRDLAALVCDIIERRDRMYCQELVLDVAGQDWKDIGLVG